jgi:hypothetical protein
MKKLLFSVVLIATSFLTSAQETIIGVYFAQTHVVAPDHLVPIVDDVDENFKLISNRESLIKVNLVSAGGEASPQVIAKLNLNGSLLEITLTGPANLPTSFNDQIGQVVHSFDDSFTGVIPKIWLQPGLIVTIETPNDSRVYNNLTIGAPNKMLINNFEITAFSEQDSELPDRWEEEFSEKFPTSELVVETIPVLFKEITIPPNGKQIAVRVGSNEDYKAATGVDFSTQMNTAILWKSALILAAGRSYGSIKYTHVGYKYDDNINKGKGGGYSSVSTRGPNNAGILLHEMGHALHLPHFGDSSDYPYKGNMHGILAPNVYNETHSGPIWSYDTAKGIFIPPTQTDVLPLTYKNDPMQGGGDKYKEKDFIANHFSDYSVHKMNKMLEQNLVVYNGEDYAMWNNTTKGYTTIIENWQGIKYPTQRDVSIISIMVGASLKTPGANIVYEPIGPYKGDLIEVFDPRGAGGDEGIKDRSNSYCRGETGCNMSVKIEQGEKTKYIMLWTQFNDTHNDKHWASFKTVAVNVPASDGVVTKVELLYTPAVIADGFPENPTVLDVWVKKPLSIEDNNMSEFLNVYQTNNNTLKITGFQNIEKASLKIVSITGKEVFAKNFSTQIINEIVIPNFSKGLYFVQILSEKNNYTQKIIIE